MVITPVEERGGLLFKREDLYVGYGGVNGTKLRQAELCANYLQSKGYKRIITGCSIHSPQAPIVASVCRTRGIECIVGYGGTSLESVNASRYARMSARFGAKVKIISRCARSSALQARLREAYPEAGMIEYGMCVKGCLPTMLEEVSEQVRNIPDGLAHLVVTTGSAFSSSSILLGLRKYDKKVGNVWLVHTAPDRREKIARNIGRMPPNVRYVSLYDEPGYVYEKGLKIAFEGISFHPQYEAKTFEWLMTRSGIDWQNEKTLFWIIGNDIQQI